jgi:alkyl hydroperoxide reductase subunit F
MNERGEILIDQKGSTSVVNIFAAGDCSTVPYKQIVVALGTGSVAALSAFEYLMRNDKVTTS